MAIPKLDRCPKCKGQLLLEADNYGLYQQCLQCGYLYDMQEFPIIKSEETEEEKESIAAQYVTEKDSRAVFRDTYRPMEHHQMTAIADPMDFHLIMTASRKRRRDNWE